MLKTITIEGLEQPIVMARRKGTRSLRITVKNDGQIRLSVPNGVPEFMAKKFAVERLDWIKKHLKPALVIRNGSHIGKSRQLRIKRTASSRSSTRLSRGEIKVMLPPGMNELSSEAQKIIRRACEKALLEEAKHLLPQRLEAISSLKNISYKSVKIQKLKSRWGACDNYKNITLNSYLMQLDWQLIDYVICHELAHTKHHHHQKSFWSLVGELYPNFAAARKELHSLPTDIIPTTF